MWVEDAFYFFLLAYAYPVVPTPFVGRIYFSIECLFHLSQTQLDAFLLVCFWTLYILLFHRCMHANPFANPISCWLLWFLRVDLKTGWSDSSSIILCFQIILAVQDLLTFHINFRSGSRDFEVEVFLLCYYRFSYFYTSISSQVIYLSWWVWQLVAFKELVCFIQALKFVCRELFVGVASQPFKSCRVCSVCPHCWNW